MPTERSAELARSWIELWLRLDHVVLDSAVIRGTRSPEDQDTLDGSY